MFLAISLGFNHEHMFVRELCVCVCETVRAGMCDDVSVQFHISSRAQ